MSILFPVMLVVIIGIRVLLRNIFTQYELKVMYIYYIIYLYLMLVVIIGIRVLLRNIFTQYELKVN